MEGNGSNPNAMDHQSNENNQFMTKALDRESEEWMEECRSILNSDEPISFQDLLAEGGILTTPRDGNVDTEMLLRMNSELNTAPTQNNDDNRGKNLIIILDDESEDDGIDARRQSYKRKLPDGSSHRMLVGETSRVLERREVSEEDIIRVNSQANFIDLEQEGVQVQAVQPQNGAGNRTGVNTGTVPQMHQNPNPMGQGWAPQRHIRRGTHGYSFVFQSPFALRNRATQLTQHTSTAHVPIRPNMPVFPPMQPSEMLAPYRPAYYSTDAQPFQQQLIWSSNFDSVPAPGIQMRNIPNRPPNVYYQMFPGNVASSSRNPAAYRPSNALWNPQGNFVDPFPRAQRPPQVANNQVEPWRPPHQGPIRTASVARPSEIRPEARNANLWPEISMASLRQAGIPPDVALNLMTTAERARLLNEVITEIRNALRLLRGNFDLVQVEFNNLVGENDDEHGDMRLDVDEFSYEELLVLEQSIGNVSTGLAEDVIEARLRSRKYRTAAFGTPSENPPCCICQEEYVEGDDTAKLLCGHYFHFNCIKQWLKEKNNCPVCKHTAVNV